MTNGGKKIINPFGESAPLNVLGDSGSGKGNGDKSLPYGCDDLLANPLGIQPTEDRILVRECPPDIECRVSLTVQFAGHRIEGHPEHGIVVATGPGKLTADGVTRLPVNAQVGQKVYFNGFMAAKFPLGTQVMFRLCPGEAVICAVEPTAAVTPAS